MRRLYYEEGPIIMGCGIAGEFRIGEPKEVPDDLAEVLLRKGHLKEFSENAADCHTSVTAAAPAKHSKKAKEE